MNFEFNNNAKAGFALCIAGIACLVLYLVTLRIDFLIFIPAGMLMIFLGVALGFQ